MDKKVDINQTREISTFRSGKYVLSAKRSLERLSVPLMECRILDAVIEDLPIFSSIREELRVANLTERYIFSSASIEGNLRSFESVSALLKTREGKRLKDDNKREIYNLESAVIHMLDLKADRPDIDITEEMIKKIHEIMAASLKTNISSPGHYRSEPVMIGSVEHGDINSAPKILSDIKVLMHEYCSWINRAEIRALSPRVRAALAAFYLTLINPFDLCNGKVARLVESTILLSAGHSYVPFLISEHYAKNKDLYFAAYKDSLNMANDLTPFIEFSIAAHRESLGSIKEKITTSIRVLALRDYYNGLREEKKLTVKQFNFLISLLETGGSVRLAELFRLSPYRAIYSTSSERTARRDLIKLKELGLIVPKGELGYEINMRAIG